MLRQDYTQRQRVMMITGYRERAITPCRGDEARHVDGISSLHFTVA